MKGWELCLLASAFPIAVLSAPQTVLEAPLSDRRSATGNLIFQSVSNILQHWPNTKYVNGKTVVLHFCYSVELSFEQVTRSLQPALLRALCYTMEEPILFSLWTTLNGLQLTLNTVMCSVAVIVC